MEDLLGVQDSVLVTSRIGGFSVGVGQYMSARRDGWLGLCWTGMGRLTGESYMDSRMLA